MQPSINLIDGPLPAYAPADPPEQSGAGALIVFEGIVRRREGDRDIIALDYQAYDPMATRMLHHMADRLIRDFDLLAVDVWHSRGRVAVGECSFRLVIRSRHRKEGLRAMDYFIDQMKQDVPIWKSPVYGEGDA